MLKLSPIRRIAAVAVASAGCVLAAGAPARAEVASRYVPGVVVVGYSAPPSTALSKDIATSTGARKSGSNDQEVDVLRIPAGESVASAAARMRRLPGVAYAVPDYVAHATAGWFPNDPGRLGVAG